MTLNNIKINSTSLLYPYLKFAKVNYHIKLKRIIISFCNMLIEAINYNLHWIEGKILRRERETSEEKIINKRWKTDGSTN